MLNNTTFNEETRVFSGRKCPPIYNPNASLGQLLYDHFLADPDHGSIVQKWIEIIKKQVNCGDVINSIVTGIDPDDPQLIHFYVAAILNGNPIHFIDYRSGAGEIESAVHVTDAKTVVVPEILEDVPKEAFTLLNYNNPSPVALFATTGTCFLPKLVPLHAESIIHEMCNPYNTKGSALTFQPLSKYRMFMEALIKISKGSSLRVRTEFSIISFQEECFKAPFDELHLTNYQLKKLVSDFKCPVEFVKHIYCSGCYANPILIRRAKSIFPNAKIVYSYGLTEFGGPVAINPDAGSKYTVGKLNDNFEVMIYDSKEGVRVGYGSPGDILVKPPVPFSGYYNALEEHNSHGWIKTGDIGYFDEELDLHILDREKEIIVYDCNAISPHVLEFYLLKVPGVEQVRVFGVPDNCYGELPAAEIVVAKGATVTEEELNEFILAQLGPLKALRGGITFVNKL